jgi:integrase/recombinase XerD
MANTFKFTKSSILIYPNRIKKSKKNGKIPIYLRLYHRRKKTEKNLFKFVPEDDLKFWNKELMLFDRKSYNINPIIQELISNFNKLEKDNLILNHLSSEQVLNYIFNKGEIKETFGDNQLLCLDFVENYYSQNIEKKPDITVGTKRNYLKVIKHFKTYLIESKKANILLTDFTNSLALEFKSYLINANESTGKKSQTGETVKGNIKKMRTIFNYGFDAKFITDNPFRSVKCSFLRKDKPKLNNTQLFNLINLKSNAVLEPYCDLFIFSTLTGVSYSDIYSLSWDSFEISNRKLIFVSSRRKKTNIIYEMYLPELAIEILNKYKDSTECKITKMILPLKSNQKTNQYLKLLANQIGINFNLTFHISRHTFRRIIRESGIIDNMERKTLMGHSILNDIDSAYYTVEKSKLLEAKEKIDNFINKLKKSQL